MPFWTTFWVTVNHEEKPLPAGRYAIKLIVNNIDGEVASTEFTLNVLDSSLPKTSLQYTDWLHYDCISHYYGEEPFTEKYYAYLNEFIKTAVRHGLTMLYTPLFTPTLDTKEGWERKTTQLVGVTVTGENAYAFDFSALAYFMENALQLGVQKFELSHLSTQWGAFFCPKVEAKKDGKTVKLFGWDTFASSTAYLTFLDSFMAAFKAFIDEKDYGDKIIFHISDEPQKEHLNNFIYQKNIIRKYFPHTKIMDALSSVEFMEEGIVDSPVVATDEAEKFREKGLLSWVYYCTIQAKNYLSNRFFNMPSQRNRMLGFQLYENGVEGFLHWGFNFYNSYLSLYPIDPYVVTDAGGVYQSGDCFIVYPDKNGVLESLRLEVFYDGINDYRALCLLETLYGKDFTLNLLRVEGVRGFTEYPRNAKWHLAFREKINRLIADKLKK